MIGCFTEIWITSLSFFGFGKCFTISIIETMSKRFMENGGSFSVDIMRAKTGVSFMVILEKDR